MHVQRLLATTLVLSAFSANADEPFPAHRIVGNTYYVGSKELASYLITTSAGHVLINSSFEETVPLIRGAVESLGFRMRDVKILLASHAHSDHVAGHALLQELTGAQVFVMEGDDRVIADGGAGQYLYVDSRWKPCRVDRVLKDGDEVKLGDAVLTARHTPGHTRGCTTWAWRESEGDKPLDVVVIGSPNVNPGYQLVENRDYPEIADDFARTFAVLNGLPCDVFLGAHGNYYGLLAKYERREKAPDVNPFIDPAGYKSYVALKAAAFRKTLADQQAASGGGSASRDKQVLIERLSQRGAVFTKTAGVVTGVNIKEAAGMTDDDFRALGQLRSLKTMQISGEELNDRTLGFLTGLTLLEDLQTNQAQLSDAGLAQFVALTNLKQIKFFHTSLKRNDFTGAGLAALAELPNLRRLTVAGCPFNDAGMAAVAKLTQLESFRTWHTYQTEAGNVHLKALVNLKYLHLGQRLRRYGGASNAPSLTVATLDVLAQLKSLDTLHLAEARLTADALGRLKTLPKLTRLELDRIDVSTDDVTRLKTLLPGVTIDWQPLGDENRAALDRLLLP